MCGCLEAASQDVATRRGLPVAPRKVAWLCGFLGAPRCQYHRVLPVSFWSPLPASCLEGDGPAVGTGGPEGGGERVPTCTAPSPPAFRAVPAASGLRRTSLPSWARPCRAPPHPVQRCGSPACPSTDFQTSPDAALPFPLPEVARPLFMFLGILPCESDSFGYPGAGLRRFFSFLFPAKSFTRFVHLLSSPPLWLPLLPAPCHAPLSGGRK